MSIVVVGSIALDTVETPHGKRNDALGGSATYFSLASSRFTKTKIVGIAGTDFPKEAIELFDEFQINTDGLDIVDGRTFRWGGRYKTNMNKRDTLFTELNVFEKFDPKLPDSYKNSEILFLGNIHPELQLNVLTQMNSDALVVLDTMNLWIDISRDKVVEVIKNVDIVIVNEDEVRQLTGTSNIFTAALRLLEMGPKTLILKKGENGAMLFHNDKKFIIPAYPVENVVDPTGAGDTFAGGFLGYLASKANPTIEDYKMAMVHGTVMASFLVESFSTDKLVSITTKNIKERIEDMVNMIRISNR